MSYMKVSGAVTAAVTALALTGVAWGAGNSPNGAPGPAGNPNQPAAAPQANGPQGPEGNDARGRSGSAGSQADAKRGEARAKGRSHKDAAVRGKAHSHAGGADTRGKARSHGSEKSQRNPSPGTPRKGGRADRPAGKITICHATRSTTNPYVEIRISVNGLHGHGPADAPRHHAGSWKDIIPAPDGGCPATVESAQGTTAAPSADKAVLGAQAADSSTPAAAPASGAPGAGESGVLGARAAGGTKPAAANGAQPAGASKVLGASASGSNGAPAAALAARTAGDEHGSLPFTGFALIVVLLAAAAALLGGFALQRATSASKRS